MDKEQRTAYVAALDHLESIYRQKNADYGNSAHHTYVEFGEAALVIRISDKLSRLQTLLSGAEAKVKDESILDTIGDAVTYLIILCAEMDTKRKGLSIEANKARTDNVDQVYRLFGLFKAFDWFEGQAISDNQWRDSLIATWKIPRPRVRRTQYMELAISLLTKYVSLTT